MTLEQLPTMDDIRELGIHEVTIHDNLQLQKIHGLSDEQTLIMMVIRLVNVKNAYVQQGIYNSQIANIFAKQEEDK